MMEDGKLPVVRKNHGHVYIGQDGPLLDRCGGRFADLKDGAVGRGAVGAASRRAIGRPLGSASFLDRLAVLTGRDPRPKKRRPKREDRGLSKASL